LDYLRAAGMPVVVVDNRCSPADPTLKDVRVLSGDFRQREVLEEAGIQHARGVLILTSDDLVNISATLMVRHLNPEVRVVVRMFNQNLIPRLGKTVKNVFALSVSGMTAPLVALTALSGVALGAFALEDGLRQVAELKIGEQSPLAGKKIADVVQHRFLVVAHTPAGGKDRLWHEVDPKTTLAPGDQLVVCGEPRDLGPLLGVEEDPLSKVLWAGWLRRYWRMIWRTLGEVDLPVKVATGTLFVVVFLSTLVYYSGGITETIPRGLYRTVSVIATGADMHEDELSQAWQKVFVSALRIFGAALTAVFTAIVTNYLLRARLGGALEVRRIPDSGHIVVCGLGNIGFRVMEYLMEYDERVVVIEQQRDSRFLATARRLGVAVIVGDATVMQVLRQAHAATARAVVAATDNELANLEIGLLARELNPRQRVVLRLYDANLAQTLREAANIRLALSIPTLAAPAFVAALFGDRVPTIFLVCGGLLAVDEVVVQPDEQFLRGQTVRALAKDFRLLPVSLMAANHHPIAQVEDQVLSVGDRLTVIASLPDLERLMRREKAPAEWAVDVLNFAPEARPRLVQLLWERQSCTPQIAESTLDHLPACLGNDLTRGQAEDLCFRLQRANVTTRLRNQASVMGNQ
jgi:Trk K+ transport system NAD-binding subunit